MTPFTFQTTPNVLFEPGAETLVATGGEDALVPPGNARILASGIPGARLAVLPGLGHRAIWEAPEDAAALVTGFLAQDCVPTAAG